MSGFLSIKGYEYNGVRCMYTFYQLRHFACMNVQGLTSSLFECPSLKLGLGLFPVEPEAVGIFESDKRGRSL